MFGVFSLLFQSLKKPYFFRYIVLSVLIAGVGMAALVGGVGVALAHTQWLRWGWLDGALDAALGVGTLWVSWLLFPLMIPLLGAFFADTIAAKVDAQEYAVSGTPALPLWPQLRGAVWFVVTSLGWNLLALIFLIFPPLWLVVYYALNGWLLGRDFFETVAVRHVLPAEASGLRKKARSAIWLSGVGLVVMSQVPVLNLLVPFVAVVVMVHVFWRVKPA